MIDIHTHILPGVDDGSQHTGESLLMAEEAIAQGVQVMVATPHLRWYEEPLTSAHIRQAVADLNNLLQAKGMEIRILPGCEIPLSDDLPERLESGEWMSLGDSGRAVLVEPLWHQWQDDHTRILQRLVDAGWTVVLAHPERHSVFQRNLALLEELVAMGVHLQVTTGSLIPGKASPASARCAYALLERQMVSVVASDCHNATSRPCDMGTAYALLQRTCGRHVAQMLTEKVPAALLRGEKITITDIWQQSSREPNRWRRFLRGILRRETDDG